MFVLVMVLNALWFGAAFRFFSFQQLDAAKVMVDRPLRSNPLFDSVAALARFLGGMNGALSLLSLLVAVLSVTTKEPGLFQQRGERIVILVVMGLAHFSQFAFNVPVLQQRRRDPETLWEVRTGPMGRIFIIDITLAVVGLGAAAALAMQST